jgi:hypothetical protein
VESGNAERLKWGGRKIFSHGDTAGTERSCQDSSSCVPARAFKKSFAISRLRGRVLRHRAAAARMSVTASGGLLFGAHRMPLQGLGLTGNDFEKTDAEHICY